MRLEGNGLEVHERDECGLVLDDDLRRLERDEADEETDAGRDRALEGHRDRIEDPLPDGREREREEDEPLDEHRQERKLPAVTHSQNDAVREEGVESHPRRQHERVVREERHQERAHDGREGRRQEHAAARDARRGENVGVHGEDVRHRHERGDPRHDFRLDGRSVFLQTEQLLDHQVRPSVNLIGRII